MPSSNTVRASVIQACTVGYDLEATLDKMQRLVRTAKAESDTQLAVFPEALYVVLVPLLILLFDYLERKLTMIDPERETVSAATQKARPLAVLSANDTLPDVMTT